MSFKKVSILLAIMSFTYSGEASAMNQSEEMAPNTAPLAPSYPLKDEPLAKEAHSLINSKVKASLSDNPLALEGMRAKKLLQDLKNDTFNK